MPALNGPWLRLGAFTAGLVAVFAAAYGAGSLAGPGTPPPVPSHGDMTAHDAGTEHGAAAHDGAEYLPAGLQVAEAGYRLIPLTDSLSDGAEFRFRIDGPDGRPVTAYTTAHGKELHLIVVRRDLSGFQHLHPSRDAAGVWSAPVHTSGPGQYRAFADFVPAGRAEGLTLGVDVDAPGDYRPVTLPAAGRTAQVDGGYTVTLEGDLVSGAASALGLRIARNGVPVTDLEPYLGAYGHLVALRAGDLAYLHVHPETGPAGPLVRFTASVPSAGRYRLYLDFQHGGTVHTAEFTVEAR
ncbi:hypothetical protein [Dactylosporangium matsuzakiense]|uniref:Secreted protein n=1 Tax=Dactylosporangium matsuzakiense TaxID=53360 RepID=A0A9W6KNQ9_9ACTN|nr:hypothetical protein [Dactylosporangium matsuzakiense]UWZ41855.1 hypothetical protein Dmats_30020 [Dactylosporangium matsuzakiense]GLL04488.1 hypothetical protein GCM10017581_062350 [Dactylosporangium matsuzakiense]